LRAWKMKMLRDINYPAGPRADGPRSPPLHVRVCVTYSWDHLIYKELQVVKNQYMR
jgi:hypothetical protein